MHPPGFHSSVVSQQGIEQASSFKQLSADKNPWMQQILQEESA